MKGLEISKSFYLEYGKDLIKKYFPDIEKYLAFGLVGAGSECFGFDDEISRAHDFEPGFCIFIPDEDIIDRTTAFRLERAYASLPGEFMGIEKSSLAAVGGARHGVIRISDFYTSKVGTPGTLSTDGWLSLPDYALAEATNGEVFEDNYGLFSNIREYLLDMPRDVRLKKLAGNLLIMAQSGQYNYPRCVSRGETGAAQLAVFEFVKSTMQVTFILSERYMPYYKWSFRAFRELPVLAGISDSLEFLVSSDNDKPTSEIKAQIIEDIAGLVIDELRSRDLTEATCGDLEKHAYSVEDRITDADIRTRHILAAV